MKKKLPSDLDSWLIEISNAYKEAIDTVPFAKILNQDLTEDKFFHLAPDICLKFRNIPKTKKNRGKVREAALCSYIATKDNVEEIFNSPIISFSLAYLAAHYGLDLLSEQEVNGIMDYIEKNAKEIMSQFQNSA